MGFCSRFFVEDGKEFFFYGEELLHRAKSGGRYCTEEQLADLVRFAVVSVRKKSFERAANVWNHKCDTSDTTFVSAIHSVSIV